MEPTQCSETSAFNTQTPGKYPEDNLSLQQHGKSLKTRIIFNCYNNLMWQLCQIRNDRVRVLWIIGGSDPYLPFSWRDWRRPCRLLSEYRMRMLVGTPGLPGFVSQLRQFIATTSLQTPNFILGAVHMRSVVDDMALGHVLAQILWSFPNQYHFTNILYHILLICHWHYIILVTDSVIKWQTSVYG
jgi:hypothetical protein